MPYKHAFAIGLLLCNLAGVAASTAPLIDSSSHPLRQLRAATWNTAQGLPQNSALAIVQTRDGYLWVGTELGLARFDGLHFTVFNKTNTPELKVNKIASLLEDREGNLWIGSLGGGLTRYRDGNFSTFTTRDGLSSDSIHCLLEDSAGNLWIGTESKGVDRLRNGHLQAFTTASGLADNEVFALAQTEDQAIWIGTHHGLSRLANGVFKTFRTPDGLPNDYVHALASAGNSLWIGTGGSGLAEWQPGAGFRAYTTRDGLPSSFLTTLRRDADGDLWIGTIGGGLSRFSRGVFSTFNTSNGLPINDIWAIYRDRNRNLWIGTGGGGLTRLYAPAFSVYEKANGLANNVVLPIFEDRSGDFWIGTDGGGVSHLHNGQFSTITTRDGLASNLVFTISEDPAGSIWIGTRKGLNRIQDGRITTFTRNDGLPGDVVTASLAASDGTLWFGGRAGLSSFRSGHFTNYFTADGLSSNVVRVIYEDSEHRIWVGTSDGLNLLENGRFKIFNSRNGLSNNSIMSLFETPDRALWIGTDGGGLNRLQNGKFLSYTVRDGLLDDSILRILQDDSGKLWMSSNKGIFRVDPQDLVKFSAKAIPLIPAYVYGTQEGMETHECNGGFQPAGWKAQDGKLWFPTMHGVAVVDPSRVAWDRRQERPLIEEAIINGRQVRARSPFLIPPGPGNLEFRYTVLNFKSPETESYRYRLSGFESDWIDAGKRRIAYYTNIPPGDYTFQVAARNANGTWSTAAARASFTLRPHYYQTTYFYAACLLALFALSLGAHILHVRQLQHRKRTLEQHVNERTSELRRQIVERERAQRESVQAKDTAERASRVKSEFLANMSHEIRTPMNGIMGMTSLLLSSSRSKQQQQYLEIIRDSADSLLTIIDDILDFSKVEAGKLHLDPTDFDLRESLDSAIRSLQLRAEQKGLQLSLDVDPKAPEIVHADSGRLRQIVLNLAGNALKFTKAGSVSVSVFCESSDAFVARLHFVVSDTGIGIPAHKLTSIFDAFSQADSSTTRKFGGTGLGLAICSRLVHLMGGAIWVESEIERGSQFHFTIEAGIGSEDEASASLDKFQSGLKNGNQLAAHGGLPVKVLLAEDNPANRMVARFTLEQAGFQVQEAENGREALQAASQTVFDLILMDCRMPVMDGYVATRHIRQLSGLAGQVPIIAMTASAFQEDRERAERAGMDDFMPKPFRERDLVTKCLTWAEASRNAAASSRPLQAVTRPPSEAPQIFASNGYSPEFLKSMFEIFLSTAPSVANTLTAALERSDFAQAKASTHWLRGGTLRFVDPSLQNRLEEVESRCYSASCEFSAPEIAELSHALHASFETAERWLATTDGKLTSTAP